ncbi:DUF1648 domain-containing protein [Paenibacillus lentus]|uniref:DUF1648 domain-containing protein n=1 Tax=Paenibacillus lentus TaxID=1338368 RepID=A0A3Q8S3B8_9BACL|nr:DUF5808 domain-containing protein [Paenibacillus lentus]AZK44824.1 DUF1648 domain-containing protein [Paenibacillus lentus]
MPILFTLMLVFMFIPIIASLAFMPYLTRETVSFGISISEETFRSAPLRQMRKRYALISLAVYIPLIFVGLYSSMQSNAAHQGTWFGSVIIVIVLFSIMLNLLFHFKMRKLKASLPTVIKGKSVLAIDTSFHHQKLALSNKWFGIHTALTLVSAATVLAYYDRIPEQIAMRFDMQGNIIHSAAKSYSTVFFPNLMQLLVIALFILVNWSIQRSKQQLNSANPERSLRQNLVFRRRWSIFTVLSGMAIVSLFSFIQLNMIYPLESSIIMLVSMLIPIFVVLFAVVLSFTTGQGGSRIERAEKGSPVQPANDDAHWKLGTLYYNPSDPSFFVEKRIGIGWTLNFAHPLSWCILAAIIIAIALPAFLSR